MKNINGDTISLTKNSSHNIFKESPLYKNFRGKKHDPLK